MLTSGRPGSSPLSALMLLLCRLKSELESTQKELRHVQEELAATNFTQESKIGRQLVAKCRALAEENEEMGRGGSLGKISLHRACCLAASAV